MKKMSIMPVVCAAWLLVSANSAGAAELVAVSKEGYTAAVISLDVPLDRMDYRLVTPTAIDRGGNFYYCVSGGDSLGFLWKIKRVDKKTGTVSDMCQLNRSAYAQAYILSIDFSLQGSLYVWIALKGNRWSTALVEITGPF